LYLFSGKTIAFALPILERLLYKPHQTAPCTRVLVLAPTRELCVQIYQVFRHLTQFAHNITACLSTGIFLFLHSYLYFLLNIFSGGLDLKSQEAALRLQPDIVIATPGRLIDHIHNSPSFTLQNIEILVLDEADR
jgi:ATP-dependent RNA helicase DDX27